MHFYTANIEFLVEIITRSPIKKHFNSNSCPFFPSDGYHPQNLPRSVKFFKKFRTTIRNGLFSQSIFPCTWKGYTETPAYPFEWVAWWCVTDSGWHSYISPSSLSFNVIQIFYYDRFFCFVCPSSDSALPLMKAKREWKRTSENDIHRYRAAARSFVSCSALRTFFESCLSIVYFFFFFSYSPLPLVLYEYDDENNICVSFLSPFWRLLIGWEYNQKRERERNTC
jgi:hypothetical protein